MKLPSHFLDIGTKMKATQEISQKNRGILQSLAFPPGLHVWISSVNAALIIDGLDRKRLWLERTPLLPCLGVLVHADLFQVTSPCYVFNLEVFFVQKINLARTSSANSIHMMWVREATGEVRSCTDAQEFDWSDLYSTAVSLVDQFIQECQGLFVGLKDSQGLRLKSAIHFGQPGCLDYEVVRLFSCQTRK
jgi:hypothetical protein